MATGNSSDTNSSAVNERQLPETSTNEESDVSSRTRSYSSVEDYLSAIHSPETKRKNAAMFLRSVSEEVNGMKFASIIDDHRKKCPPHRQRKFYAWHWRVAIDSVIFLQRLKAGISEKNKEDKGSSNNS